MRLLHKIDQKCCFSTQILPVSMLYSQCYVWSLRDKFPLVDRVFEARTLDVCMWSQYILEDCLKWENFGDRVTWWKLTYFALPSANTSAPLTCPWPATSPQASMGGERGKRCLRSDGGGSKGRRPLVCWKIAKVRVSTYLNPCAKNLKFQTIIQINYETSPQNWPKMLS